MATPAVLQEDSNFAAASGRRPSPNRLWIQASLFVITLFSTTIVGMRYMANFQQGRFPLASDADIFPYQWVVANFRHISLGLPFSLTLLSILLTHEFGHYFACRHFGIRATLPYLIPAPSLSGTAGAVIRLHSRVKSRSALLTIGALGPIAGFLLAIVMSCIGLSLSVPAATVPAKLVEFTPPLLFHVLGHFFPLALSSTLIWHPILVAAWIGLLITSLNLLPAGQLDGGHILYSLSPRLHRIATYTVMAGLVYLGVTLWLGWLLWAALLCLPGMRHPKVDNPTPVPTKILLLAPIALVLLILTATPQPFSHTSLIDVIHRWRS
jgi:membrane-associated protease RseP (regulator of RpoE activity)